MSSDTYAKEVDRYSDFVAIFQVRSWKLEIMGGSRYNQFNVVYYNPFDLCP